MRKLSRKRNQRKALLKLLAENFFLKEKVLTTEARAKELSRFAESLIGKGKNQNSASKRYLARFFSKDIVKKLSEIALRYKERKGGYTRIIKIGPRQSDGAKMAIIELVK